MTLRETGVLSGLVLRFPPVEGQEFDKSLRRERPGQVSIENPWLFRCSIWGNPWTLADQCRAFWGEGDRSCWAFP